jgi:hypothetical protein
MLALPRGADDEQKPEAATRWSRRVMARATDLSPSTIGRLIIHGVGQAA